MRDGTYRGPAEQPFISAVVFDGTDTEPFSTSFLIDSGADGTVLSVEDAARSGFIEQDVDENGQPVGEFSDGVHVVAEPSNGVGGKSTVYSVHEQIHIGFAENDGNGDLTHMQYERLNRFQVAPNIPVSLLGRDVLNRFDVTFSYSDNRVELERTGVQDGWGTSRTFD